MVTDASLLTRPDAPPAFHLLAKPTGAICNLDCEYCFFLSKEMLYPGSPSRPTCASSSGPTLVRAT